MRQVRQVQKHVSQETLLKLRVFDLRDGDTKTIRNLLAYRKVDVEGETEEFWVPTTIFDNVSSEIRTFVY